MRGGARVIRRTLVAVALLASGAMAVSAEAVPVQAPRAAVQILQQQRPHHGPGWACRYQAQQRGTWTRAEVEATIRCAVRRWPTSLSTALYVAERESHFSHRAYNASSGACGVFQHLERYWRGRVTSFLRATGPRFDIHHPGCMNARANVLVSIWMASRGGWDPWSM